MIVIAGGIGAGKSVVARILRLKGFGVFDCDLEARRMMEEEGELIACVRNIAGEDVYDSANRLDRALLASRLFADPEIRRSINREVHSAVRKRIEEWMGSSKRNLFVETAIGGESGIAAMAGEIWLVDAPEELRIERVMERDRRPEEQIKSIIDAQRKEEERLAESGARVVRLINDGKRSLLQQIEKELKTLNENIQQQC